MSAEIPSQNEAPIGTRCPLLPLRDIVIFPHMVVPLFVGRPQSISALEQATKNNGRIFLATQRDPKTDNPALGDIYPVGTIGHVVQMLKLPDGTVKVLVEGKTRARIEAFYPQENQVNVDVVALQESDGESTEIEALVRTVHDAFESYVGLSKKIPSEVGVSTAGIADPSRLADTIAGHLQVPIAEKQEILEQTNTFLRLEQLFSLLGQEIEILQIETKIRSRVKTQMERSQREYYLNEQMRAIQKELGEKDEFKQELQEFSEQITQKKMSKEATDKALAELRKLKMMSPMSAEASVVRNYIEWLLALPWRKGTKDNHDLGKAEKILNADHYGLEKVKERVLEYLAVRALVKKDKGPILCLAGPPGVGKTSLGQSVAKALGRKFVRISLGGVRDEAEIRGHRRTYVGAMPGKIIQSLKKAGVRNPVFMLDEIDKMSMDFRGDPSSALLEVLDPEQNNSFADHFLDVDYDLSQVIFIATANNLHQIPPALHDRLEVLRIEGYSEEEKLHIAKQYLLPKQSAAHGFSQKSVTISDRALYDIVRRYTREAGVRSLDRHIAKVFRKIAVKKMQKGGQGRFVVGANQVRKYLGVPVYEFGVREEADQVGVVTGLAWTETGGELLNVEATVLPGSGKLMVTGQLGDVMQESASAALSYVRSRWQPLGLAENFYASLDIHIHVPAGAVPKDGPSAGITMATALVSALTHRPVRRDLAMSGELTLRGRVLAIGGLKEKLLAARRGGILKVLLPQENEKNLVDLPRALKESLSLVCVRDVDQVLAQALVESD